MSLLLPLLIALIGLLFYFATNDKKSTVGLYTYVVGLLVFLLQAGPHMVTLLGR